MTGRVTVLTPRLAGGAIELGRKLWRKQILPIGHLDYEGRRLHFTKDYLGRVVEAFKARAFDAVPFQLANDRNEHTHDPERTRGDVVGLDLGADGLYGTFAVTDKGDEILREFPNLGVSVRLVEELERGTDGAQFPVALQHVLATWDPRVNAMKPWQEVTCSNESADVIDLSALVFTPDGSAVAAPTSTEAGATHEKEAGRMPEQPTKEELAQVLALAPLLKKIAESLGTEDGEPANPAADTTTGGGNNAATGTPPAGAEQTDENEFTEAELAELAAAANEAGDGEDEGEDAAIAASNKVAALELANVDLAARMDALSAQNARMQAERDELAFKAEAEDLARSFGVPPAIVALAKPLLAGAGHTIELSGGDRGKKIDAGQVMRQVLRDWGRLYKELGAAAGVNLSGAVGTPLDLAGPDEATDREEFLVRAKNARFAQ